MKWIGSVLMVLALVTVVGCGQPEEVEDGQTTPATTVMVDGAGATFPYPIYARWADEYNQRTGIKINYQSIGSGGGIAQIKADTVDFGATDAPLEPEELAEAGLVQWPQIIGGVVPVVNVAEIPAGELKLSPDVLADIFLGTITKWNDPRIAELNPGIGLPDLDITVVHRADGSGTTWIFTNYVAKVSPTWSEKVGFDKAVSWPTGIGGKGNEGVAAYVQRVNGAIGYVEFAYALQNRMNAVQLRNQAGNYVRPTIESFQAAAANADWQAAPGYYLVLTDQPGEDSWPVTGASFILVHQQPGSPEEVRAALDFFAWAFAEGGDMATELDYVPMPDNVVAMVQETWRSEITADGQPVWEGR